MQSIITDIIKPGDVYYRNKLYSSVWCCSEIDKMASYIEQKCQSFSPFIHLFASNSIKTVIAYFAIVKAGKVTVILSPDLGRIEIKEISINTPPGATLNFDTRTDEFNYDNEIVVHSGHEVDIAFDQLVDVCTMVYTAADDGFAKAAMLTHHNIYSCANAIGKGSNYDQSTICCAALPFDHMFGLQTGILAPFLYGGKIQIADVTSKDGIIQTIKNIGYNKITNLYSVPVLLFLFGKFKDYVRNWLPDITVTSGSCKLDDSIRQHFKEEFGIHIYEGYGLTEASPVCTWQFPGDKIITESLGKEISCCKVKIVNENWIECLNEIGEIVICGDNVMQGYYKYKTVSEKTIVGGWLKTGDLGKIDNAGNVYLTGLKKRMLNMNGKKVYPAEIERLLSSNFKVPVAIESKENRSGLILKAVIACKSDDQVLNHMNEWCKANLSREKRPQMFLAGCE